MLCMWLCIVILLLAIWLHFCLLRLYYERGHLCLSQHFGENVWWEIFIPAKVSLYTEYLNKYKLICFWVVVNNTTITIKIVNKHYNYCRQLLLFRCLFDIMLVDRHLLACCNKACILWQQFIQISISVITSIVVMHNPVYLYVATFSEYKQLLGNNANHKIKSMSWQKLST